MIKNKKGSEDNYWQDKWKELGRELNVSGLRYATGEQEHVARRILWTALIVGGLSIMLYQIAITIVAYYERPVSVELKYKYVDSVTFPSVTICNENRYMRSKVKALGIEQEIQDLYPVYDGTLSQSFFSVNQTVFQTLATQFGSSRNVMKNISMGIDEMFLFCYFKGERCNSTWFEEVWTVFGLCYTFLPNAAQSGPDISSPGQLSGLWLSLNSHSEEHIALFDYGSGFRVAMHDSGVGYTNMGRLGFTVSAGQVTNVKIHKSELSYLPAPYGECVTGRTLRRFSSYTKDQCELECIADYVATSCGCANNGFPSLPGERICNIYEDQICGSFALYNYESSNAAVECDCDQTCSETTYSQSISSSIISEYVIETFANNTGVSKTEVRGNAAVLLVYYPDAAYTSLKTNVAYTLTQLFNDIGGALGLMLGSTFLTIYEAIDFFIWAGVDRRQKAKRIADGSKANLKDLPDVSV